MKTRTSGTSAAALSLLLIPTGAFHNFARPVGCGVLRREAGFFFDSYAFVPGAFPPKAVDELRKDDWYKKRLDEVRDAYLANRKNGVEGDSPAHPFPGDGAYSWDTPESEMGSKIRYTEGPQDKAWMEARDRNYVFRLEREGLLDKDEPKLKTEVPKLYAEVMAKRQGSFREAEEKMAQETEVRQAEERARKEAELAAQQREKAKEIAKALLIGRKQLSKSKEGAHWKKDALKTFREILEKQPNHFEAWSRVVTLLTEANTPEETREALKMIMSFEPSVLKSDQQNTGTYIALVNQLAARLLASGNIEMMRGALKMVALALSCFPDEASLTQGRQQIVDKLSTRAQFLQNLGTLRSSDTGAPQHSPRTDYAYLTQAFALEENISTYTGEEGEANRAFLESELDKLGEKIKPLPKEGQEVAQQRALRLQQEQQAWEAAQQTLAAGPAAEAKPESERSVSSSERVRQWREANAAAVDPNERSFADEQDASDRESDDDASIVTAQFRSSDCNLIANELVKRIRCEGAFGVTIEEDEYIEIRCRPDKVASLVVQALKATLSKLFTGLDCNDSQVIRLPWEQLNDKQVRKFEVLFAREKQDIRLASIQDAGEDIKSGVDGVARRVAPTP